MFNNATARFFAAIVLFSAMAPIAVEIYVPSMPYIQHDLHASSTPVQLSMTACLFGAIIPGVIFGYMSDFIGRKPILVYTSILGLIGTIVCVAAPNIYLFIIGRILQGVGFSGVSGIGRALLRDKLQGIELARYAAYLAMAIALSIDLTPFIGGILQQFFSWRIVFGVVVLIAGVVIYSSIQFEETLSQTQAPVAWRKLGAALWQICWVRGYLRYNAVVSLIYATFISYFAVASFIIQKTLHISAMACGFTMLSLSLVYALTCFVNGKLLRMVNIYTLAKLGLLLITASGIALISIAITQKISFIVFYLSVLPMFIGCGFAWSNIDTLVYLNLSDGFGIAATLALSIRTIAGVVGTAIISLFNPLSTLAIGSLFAVFAICSLILMGRSSKAQCPYHKKQIQ